jgi:UDP-N-acetylmuramoylalanine--D-glutamate ligase
MLWQQPELHTSLGIQPEVISSVLKSFQGVEHRIEFVREVNKVYYYNDSKGTNPDASIKAVEAMTRPTVLIAGGMDKGSTFDELIEAFGGRIIKLIVLGETAAFIEETAHKLGFNNVARVATMDEAVTLAAAVCLRVVRYCCRRLVRVGICMRTSKDEESTLSAVSMN